MRRLRDFIGTLTGGYPLNDVVSRGVSPLLIIGCGRSGNTLLRSMLVRGGEIAIPPESYVWPALVEEFAQKRSRPWAEIAEWAVEMFRQSDFGLSEEELAALKRRARDLPNRSLAAILDSVYRHFSGDRRWGDKTPYNTLHLQRLTALFPSAQYIHIVRDPRAVALSMVKAAAVSPQIREDTFELAVDRWNVSVGNARRLARLGGKRYFELRYEDLTADPQAWLEKVCAFAGLEFSPAMMSFHEGAAALGDVLAFAHHANLLRPLDPTRGEAWRDEIAPQDYALVSDRTRKLRAIYGYSD